ncbi:hypothetical protein OEZ85_011804 [Tetradesmus obliquus]|uniref:Uncharacterized protein n=2 Tax=Tetradesmus obliquus TaxID=3088 RepID=A0A383V9Q7_TETOB|nr:hypothetical protein OEZ85_011804 [Tetradesmus obliquus]|eukprot:jgi/Sobl393_1/3643/SZX62315.1
MALVVKPSAVIKALWFSVGTGAAYAAYLKLHKDLWTGAKQVAQAHGTLPPQQPQQQPERLFGPAARATLAAQWNGLVDDTLGRLAQELGKRGI